MRKLLFALVALAVMHGAPASAGPQAPESSTPSRIASDFEIAQMEQQVARSRDFVSQFSARLNLGDLRMTRNERSLASVEYERAFTAAASERLAARRNSDMTRYATATSYAALALAKLDRRTEAFPLLEEAMRYSSDSAKSWNLYSTATSVLGLRKKATSAARNAVAIATRDLRNDASIDNRLDLAVYQYALASALMSEEQAAEAERLLVEIVRSLESREFEAVRRDVAAGENFEIYSTARGDESAYLSLLNRSQLRLAALYERAGKIDEARSRYERVLASRNDDPTALAALARLSRSDEERERFFAEAFDANPFSMALVREYQRYLATLSGTPLSSGDGSTGSKMRQALQQMQRGEDRAAREALDALIRDFPSNDTLRVLRREIDQRATGLPRLLTGDVAPPTAAELRLLISLFADDRLTPEQRATLDRAEIRSIAIFDESAAASGSTPESTVFETGTIDGVAFRFSEPTVFSGSFAAGVPLRLTYRILGSTRIDGRDALLLEPLRLEPGS
jgi:tetratricopeptide (TPR) repeat protein